MRAPTLFAISILLTACGSAETPSAATTDASATPDAPIDHDGSTPTDAPSANDGGPPDAPPPAPPFTLAVDGYPTGIAVDSRYVYWAEEGSRDAIKRADLDGSNVVVLANDFPDVVYPRDVVLSGDDVYWTDKGSSSSGLPAVARCAKTGCLGGSTPLPSVSDFSYGVGLAIGDAGIFFAGKKGGGFTQLWRISGDGGASGMIDGNGFLEIGSLAVDDSRLYFGVNGRVGAIAADAPLLDPDAGASANVDWLAAVPAGLDPVTVFADATSIYYADARDSGNVGVLPKSGVPDGGAPRVLASGIAVPMRVVADDTSIYFTVRGPDLADGGYSNFGNGSLMKCPKTGCPATGPTVLATGLPWLSGYLAVDATSVYFTQQGDRAANLRGAVQRLPK